MGISDVQTQYGATLGYEATPGSGTFTPLALVKEITPPAPSRDFHEKTHLASPDEYKEYYGGLMDTDEATAVLVFSEEGLTDLYTVFALGETGWKITARAGSTLTFTGALSKIGIPTLINGEMTCEVSIKRTTAKPVWTEGA